ncbi:MAG: hypothetical protein MUE51_01660 [Thermoleophilia bacterium]|jgi:hypothetical protein|nr:hypothetical protein [Thermoleophilia bacterium]
MRARAPIALALLTMLAASGPAAARLSILYDTADQLREVTGLQPDGRPGLGERDGMLQQQPAPLILPARRHAWKVSGGAGSDATPTLIGRDAEGMAALLRERIRRAGAHLVFLDELTTAFRGPDGTALRGALEILAREPSPWGGGTLNRRVHVYVPAPTWLIADRAAAGDAWAALALAGGVWLQAYRAPLPPTPWEPEQWLAWPRAVAEGLAAAGGDPARLHLLLTGGDQAAQWSWARTGSACALLGNGPGAYRLGGDAAAFVGEFRAAFGEAPAPAGPSPLACLPAPVPAPETAAALTGLLAAPDEGVLAPPGAVTPAQAVAGRPVTVRVALGPDPLGVAARLGADPAAFWAVARPRVIVEGQGVRAVTPLGADGTARVTVTPSTPGPLGVRVLIDGAAVREALGGPVDLLAATDPEAARLPTMRGRIAAGPLTWTLPLPLGTPGDPRGAPVGVLATAPAPPPAPPRAARVVVTLAGPALTRRLRVDPRRGHVAVVRVLTRAGAPVPGAPLVVRLPNGRGQRLAADARGVGRIAVPKRAGRLTVAVVGTRVTARRTIAGPPVPRRLR